MSLTNTQTATPASEHAQVDVAVNIFAKPYQTALSILSLLKHSGWHINQIWLQFEPVGSKFDAISPYVIVDYLKTRTNWNFRVSQPQNWLAREPVTGEKLRDAACRKSIRYQNAFENSKAKYLFLMHNDVFIMKDILGAMLKEIDGAFAIGQLGQCWNCPAQNPLLANEVLGTVPCGPDRYTEVRPSYEQLLKLHKLAQEKGIFVRPYDRDGLGQEFKNQPWPLPECRINEWACLLNLSMVRALCAPFGECYPPGAFKDCQGHNLDIGVAWFRDMHANGMFARNFDLKPYVRHWVGTGNKSANKYAYSEDRAKNLLQKHFPEYLDWLNLNISSARTPSFKPHPVSQ